MSDVAFIFSKIAHDASSAFARSINADFYSVSRYSWYKIFSIPGHKKYMVESIFALTYPILKRKILREKNKIVLRNNSNIFSDEPRRYFQGNAFVRGYIRFLLRNIDGIIAVSNLVKKTGDKKCLQQIDKMIPTLIVHSFVDPDKWKEIRPALNTNNFLHIGYLRHHKGIGILMKAFDIIAEKHENVKIYLAGISEKDLQKYKIKKAKNAVPLGFTKKLKSYMKDCAFYITTPKYEPGPTASLEAMAAGLIPIVNNRTGHKDHVEKIDKKLVINSLRPEEVARGIENILKIKDRSALSRKSRKLAVKYSRENQMEAFKKAFGRLVK